MKVCLLCLGKTNKKYVQEGMLEFEKRLQGFCKYERIELRDVKTAANSEKLKELEYRRFIEAIKPNDFVILLDEKGKVFDSRSFADTLESWQLRGKDRLVFIIAGAFGAAEDLKSRADERMSLSKMTFSHQLVRLIFTEQIYRAYAIIHKHPYHND